MLAYVRLARPQDWAHSKLPFVAAAALLVDVSAERTLFALATIVPWAAFGYGLNELSDRVQDARAGRRSRALGLGGAQLAGFLAVTATATCASSLLWSNGLVVAAGLALAVAYSAPPLRLKERGATGVVAGATAQWFLPVLAVAGTESTALLALSLAVGLRWLLVHQLLDADADRRGGVGTFGATSERIQPVLRGVFALELVLLVVLLVSTHSAPAVLALLPTLAWRRPCALPERLNGYVDAPLSAYYFCLLPAFLAFAQPSPASFVLAATLLVLGTPAVLGALPRARLAAVQP